LWWRNCRLLIVFRLALFVILFFGVWLVVNAVY
jgi:hypothetical protein